jgi:hypothetical protein
LVTAGFVVAAIAFILPFADPSPGSNLQTTSWSGIELVAFMFFFFLVSSHSYVYAFVFVIPFVAAISGVLYRRVGRVGSVARLSAGAAGFAGLAIAYAISPHDHWDVGYFAAEAGFLVATLASIATLTGALRFGELDSKPAPAASSELT